VSDSPGVHLVRTEENVDEIEALAARLGGRVGRSGCRRCCAT